MTVSTSINSLMLTFGPLLVTYQALKLKQFNAYPGCFFGAIAFLLTQVAKFIIMAIVFPIVFPSEDFAAENEGGSGSDTTFVVEHDVLKALVSMIDLVGLYYIINAKKLFTVMGDIDIRLISIGLGWAAAELVTTHLLDVVFQGWSNEFKVEYLINGLSANIDILEIISITFLTYTLTKKEESSKKNLVYLLALGRYLLPVALKYVNQSLKQIEQGNIQNQDGDWCCDSMYLGAKAGFAGLLYVVSQQLK
eukprot:403375086